MKKYSYHIALGLLILAACAKEEVAQESPVLENGQEAIPGDVLYISASLETAATRTSMGFSGDTRPVLWSENDAIGIIATDGSVAEGTLSSGSGASKATFSYGSGALSGDIAYGYYPYNASATVSGTTVTLALPAVQAWSSTSVFDAGVALMAAKLSEGQLFFTNACAVVEFKMKGSARLTKVHLRSLTRPLAGTGTLDLSADAPVFAVSADAADAAYQVTLDLGNGVQLSETAATSFYFVVPAGTYDDLFVMTEGDSGSWQVLSSASHSLRISHVQPFGELTLAAPASATDLSDGGKYANCYILDPDATGVFSFGLNLVDGSAVRGAVAADCLWETSANLVQDVALDVAAGRIYFKKSAAGEGNALLAAMDAAGQVLQTWHIWVTEYSDQTWGRNNNYATKTSGVTYVSRFHTFMDRNLGATFAPAPAKKAVEQYTSHTTANFNDYSAQGKAAVDAMTAAQAVEACGFLYQFGREIPFPAVNEAAFNATQRAWEGGGSKPFQTWTRSLVIHPFYPFSKKFELANLNETRSGLKAYPLTYNKITSSISPTHFTSWATDAVYTGAWSENKTNSDPCPYGYRVPKKSELYIFRKHKASYQRPSDNTWQDYVSYTLRSPYGTYFTSYAAHAVGGTSPLTSLWDYQFVYVPFAGFRSGGGSASNTNSYTGVIKNGELALWCFEPADNGAEHAYVGYDTAGGDNAVFYPNNAAFSSGDVYAPFMTAIVSTGNIYEPNGSSKYLMAQTASAMSVRCVKIEE